MKRPLDRLDYAYLGLCALGVTIAIALGVAQGLGLT